MEGMVMTLSEINDSQTHLVLPVDYTNYSKHTIYITNGIKSALTARL